MRAAETRGQHGRLKKEIGIATMWYIIGIKLQSLGATPARQQATFVNLYDKAAALLAAIKAFPSRTAATVARGRWTR